MVVPPPGRMPLLEFDQMPSLPSNQSKLPASAEPEESSPRRLAIISTVILLGILAVMTILEIRSFLNYTLMDFGVYYDAAMALRTGEDMFGVYNQPPLTYIYPPLLAVLFIPFTYLPIEYAAVIPDFTGTRTYNTDGEVRLGRLDQRPVYTDPSGRFRIANVLKGPLRLQVRAPGGLDQQVDRVPGHDARKISPKSARLDAVEAQGDGAQDQKRFPRDAWNRLLVRATLRSRYTVCAH